MRLAAIMTEPDFAEVMFLVAFIVFIVGAFVAWVIQPRALWALVISIGLAVVSLGWLAHEPDRTHRPRRGARRGGDPPHHRAVVNGCVTAR